MRPPWRFETKLRSASEKKPIDCSRRVLAIGGIFFDSRSTFDLVMGGQRSIFGEIDVFSTVQENSGRSYGRYRHENVAIVFGGQLASF